MTYSIDSIVFGRDSVVVSYMEDTDVRVAGAVAMQRRVSLSMKHPDYREDAELLEGQAQRMLRNALEDFAASPPHLQKSGDDDDNDDDDRGMGE